MAARLRKLESRDGIPAVLRVALPLVFAASSHAIKIFADRVMLANYSAEAIRAALPAGVTCFTFMALPLGVAGYASTFVAQYTGAERSDRAGLGVWQGIYVALVGGLALAVGALFAEPLFRLFAHDPAVQWEEARYFRFLAIFAVFTLLNAALSSLWSGRGRTRTIMAVSIGTAALNIGLNLLLIYGLLGFPRLGVAGAAIATGASEAAGTATYLALFLRRRNRFRYGTWPRNTLDRPLLARLLRFGLPSGVHFSLDVAAFNAFIMLMGVVGRNMGAAGHAAQEAANIAFSVNAIAFIPMVGIGQAVAILVGQAVGARDVGRARRSTGSARKVVLVYVGVIIALFLLAPGVLLSLFARAGDPTQAETLALARHLLLYVAAWLLFDCHWVIYSGAIRGAGDTRFAMVWGVAVAWLALPLPSYLAYRFGGTIDLLWTILLSSVILGAIVFYLRFRSKAWESKRVIEV